MPDRPINLKDWQVRAALDGRLSVVVVPLDKLTGWTVDFLSKPPAIVEFPWKPGDRLWVREAWKTHSIYDHVKASEVPETNVFYRADNRYSPSGSRWRASTQLPRWASRLTLIPKSVRVARVQEVTEYEARAMGSLGGHPAALVDYWTDRYGRGSWGRNDWCAIATVDVHHRNIDSMPER